MKSKRHGISLPCFAAAGALLWLTALHSHAAVNIHSAVLPSSRSVQVGTSATFFATIINDGDEQALGCRIELPDVDGIEFSFQRSRSRDNNLIGERNESASIPAGGKQSFVLFFDTSAPIPAVELVPAFLCDNASPASNLSHINTLDFAVSSQPVADIISFSLTGSADGRLEVLSERSQEAFVVAVANMGEAASLKFAAALTQPTLPLDLSWCQTDPLTSTCLSNPVSEPIESVTLGTDAIATFAVFAAGRGNLPFRPATDRIVISLSENGETRSRASVAPFTRNLPQDPDTSFGIRGEVSGLGVGSSLSNNARDLVVLPDGKIVVAAYEWAPQNFPGKRVLARFNTDGSRDTTFGFEREEQEGFNQTLLLLPNGKFIVGGSSGFFGYISRYNADGSADISFGEEGQTAQSEEVRTIVDISVQNDGGVIALQQYGGLLRYTADGTLDLDFADTALGLDENFINPEFRALGILPDGKILVAGTIFSRVPVQNRQMLVARFLENGLLDTDFNSNGLLMLSYASGILEGQGRADSSLLPMKLAVLPDGAALILTLGATRLIKLTPSGQLDLGYGEGGITPPAECATGDPFGITPFNMTVLADQRVLVTGLAFEDSLTVGVTGLERYLPSGETDLSFGRSGCLLYQHQPGSGVWEWPAAVAAGPDEAAFVLSNLGSGEFGPDGELLLLKLVESH